MTHFNWRYLRHDRLTLGKFLMKQGVTKSLMKQVKFHGGVIEVNHHLKHTNYKLRADDLVGLTLPPEPSNPNVMVSNRPIQVVYENSNYLIVDKPVGMPSVPSKKYYRDTLINRVKGYYRRKHYTNLKMHIVTRLDRVTSGLVIFAKNHLAHSILDAELKRNQIQKDYFAIINGKIGLGRGTIVLPMTQDPNSLVKRTVSSYGRFAKTEFRVLKTMNDMTWVEVKLDTGRTHQIRVHFGAIGHPLVGDWLYNPHDHRLDRLALHCFRVAFYDPLDLCQINGYSKMPTEMQTLIS